MADEPTPEPPAEPPTPDNDNPELGEKGEKALTAMKEQVKTLKAEARKTKDLEAEVSKLREANASEAEKALEAAKAEGDQGARTELGSQLTSLRVELAVLKSEDTKKLADPDDLLVNVTVDDITDGNGHVDPKALTAAIDDLLTRKPHLAATARRVPQVPGGPRQPGAPDPGPGKARIAAAYAQKQ